MALTLRRSRLDRPAAFEHLADWEVWEDGQEIGRIYEVPAANDGAGTRSREDARECADVRGRQDRFQAMAGSVPGLEAARMIYSAGPAPYF